MGGEEIWDEGSGVELFVVGEAKDESFGPAVDVFVDIDGVGVVVVDEVVSLAVDHLVVFVGFFLPQHHVLQGGQRLSYLLNVVTGFVLSSSVFALVGVGVVLTSLLDLVLGPFLVFFQEDFFDVGKLDLQIKREFS